MAGLVEFLDEPNCLPTNASCATSNEDVQASVSRAREAYADMYGTANMSVDSNLFDDDDDEPTVSRLAVDVVMLPRSQLRHHFQPKAFDSLHEIGRTEHVFAGGVNSTSPVSLESLFQDIPTVVLKRKETLQVDAIASVGCGKTTTFTKMAPCLWGNIQVWVDQFDIVVASELRFEDARMAKGVRDLLALDALDIEEEDRRKVERYVHQNPHRVCVILDGLDETSLSSCSSFVSKVLHGESLEGIRLIITSRPSRDIFSLANCNRHILQIEVVGFRPDDVEVYVRKMPRKNQPDELMKIVNENENVRSMMCTPLLAYEICKLYHWQQRVPLCVAELFDFMILRLAERRSARTCSKWDEVPNDVQQKILRLGSFAFRMLRQQRFVFSETELRSFSMHREAMSLGMLVECESVLSDSGDLATWRCRKVWP